MFGLGMPRSIGSIRASHSLPRCLGNQLLSTFRVKTRYLASGPQESAIMASDSEKAAVSPGTHDLSSVNALIPNVDKYSEDVAQLESKLDSASLDEGGTPVTANTTTRYFLRSQNPNKQSTASFHQSHGHARNTSPKRDWITPTLKMLPRPQPTADYLKQACKASTRSKSIRPLLIIADLNGCLLDRGKNKSGVGHHRPYLKELLEYCLDNHHVMVWSSATPANVRSMSSHAFAGLQKQPIAIWDRSSLQLTNAQSKERVQVYKQLHWVWDDKQISGFHPHASSGGSWDQTNTILIDDSIEKAAAQPHNQLVVPEYKKEMAEQEEKSKVLLTVIEYLKEAAYHEDVSSFIYNDSFQKWMVTGTVAGETCTTDSATDTK